MRYPFLGAVLFATLAVPSSARSRDTVPAATATGPARSCIPIRSIRESLVRSDQVIDFQMTGRKIYRVTLPQECPGLGFERRFIYRTSLSVLCQQDLITVLRTAPVMNGASCGLAPFQPVELAKR